MRGLGEFLYVMFSIIVLVGGIMYILAGVGIYNECIHGRKTFEGHTLDNAVQRLIAKTVAECQ